jgi:radical SAM protein with 4Fe4S-binding SPASM domain
MSTKCKLAKLSLNFDMSGMVQPCNLTTWYLKDLKDERYYNVLTDDVKTIWESEHRKKLITDHDSGVRNPTCNTCWHSEDAGIESFRQKFNKELKDVEVLESQPRVMIVKPGNLCNNACRSCNAHTSSMWYKTDYALDDQGKTFKEYLKFFHRHKTAYYNNKLLEQRFAEWEDNIIEWDMYGGEPMISPLFFKLLDQAVNSNNAKEKMFSVHTNGMVYKEDLVERFSRFKSAHIGFSIDAIGSKNDYIRYGSKWEDIIGNFRKYISDCEKYDNVSISVRTTYTPWNIYYYDEIYDFFQKHFGINASGTWCDDKPWNDIRYLPGNVKERIIEKLSRYKSDDALWIKMFDILKKWIFTEPEEYEKLQHSFEEFNSKVDNIRKERFDSIFQEYSKLFK